MYLLDTNIVIYLIKRKPESVLMNLEKYTDEELNVSAVTVAELEFGIECSAFPEKNRIALIEVLSIFEILPFDDTDAVVYGKIKADFKRKGIVIGPMDLLIGSQAVAKNLTLVTNNEKEFRRVPDLPVVNWVE